MSSSSFALKYRPKNLERVIGHEQAVTRLQGIIAGGKIRNALGFFGPSSVGKTTLARAFAASVNGAKSVAALGPAYLEINAGTTKGIEEMRELERISRFKVSSKYRVIVIDEAQMILTNQHATNALLKPLEEPANHMIWVLCSMDPSKFQTHKDGKAILNRLSQFNLIEPNDEALTKYAKRIIKGEEMTYMTDEGISQVVNVCSREMRTLANLLEGIDQYVAGLPKKPKKFSPEMLGQVLEGLMTNEDAVAQRILMGIYQNEFQTVLAALLDVTNAYSMVQKLLFGNSYLLYRQALGGKNHAWLKHWAPLNKSLAAATKGKKVSLGMLVTVNAALVQLKNDILAQGANFHEVAAARLFELVSQLEK